MIYPLVHNTITQYRGPRFDSELVKFFNSVTFDVNVGFAEVEYQAEQIDKILNMYINGTSAISIQPETSLDIQEVGEPIEAPSHYASNNTMTSKLDNIEITLKQYMLSIY